MYSIWTKAGKLKGKMKVLLRRPFLKLGINLSMDVHVWRDERVQKTRLALMRYMWVCDVDTSKGVWSFLLSMIRGIIPSLLAESNRYFLGLELNQKRHISLPITEHNTMCYFSGWMGKISRLTHRISFLINGIVWLGNIGCCFHE